MISESACKLAYYGNIFLVIFKRENIVLVFKKYDRLFRNFARNVVRLFVIGFVIGLKPRVAFEYKAEHSFDDDIEFLFAELAFFYGIDYLLVCNAAARGHFEVKPRAYAFYAVVGSVPVAHYDSVEAPFVSQYIGQKTLVVGEICTVEFVVRTHYGIGLSLDSLFESGKINFSKRTLVYDGIYRHTQFFLVVCAEVLKGSTYVV